MRDACQRTEMKLVQSRVLLIDPFPMFRAGLAMAIQGEPDLHIVAEVDSAADAVVVARERQVDVAILPVLMPISNGLSLVPQLQEIHPTLRILALCRIEQPLVIAAMLRSGASGYALKTQDADEIVCAIRAVLAGDVYVPPHVQRDIALGRDTHRVPVRNRLSRREREVFDLIIHGSSNEQIAARLFLSPRTVETHRLHVARKLGVRSLMELVRIAAREGAVITE
jgi:two-component system response regulator NreC